MSESLPLNYERSYNKDLNNKSSTLHKSIYIGKVISNVDNKNLKRLKVRIDGIDNRIPDNDLVFCYQLDNKMIDCLPNKGELVRVFINDLRYPLNEGNRYWVGPIIGNYKNIKNQPYLLSDNVNISDITLSENAENNVKEETDVFPTKSGDVSMLGRDNTDIIQSDSKIIIRAGKHKKGKPSESNRKNPVYDILEFISDDSGYKMSVGDEIFLISHNGRKQFNKIITQNDINDIRKNSQSLLYGELTIDLIKSMADVLIEHTHQHPQTKAITDKKMKLFLEKLSKIEELLAKNIKIN